jgi:small-conductance mechanosensitive channel
LESKDKTIISLQEKTEALQTMIAEAQAAEQESQNRATAANEAAAAAGTAAADKAAIVDMLTAKLNEAEGKLGSFDTIRAEAQAAQEQVKQLQGQLKEAEYTHKAALMEVEYKAAQDKAAAQEQAAKEREQLERNHAAEVKELYEKMSVYQDQIATLTKNQIEKKEKPQRKSKVTAKSTAQEKGGC